MRLQELHLLKYGMFEGERLSFPRESQDLQIIYGPNEAGKSTTLAAVTDLLFGFPHITPYDFKFDKSLLRIGAIIETADQNIEVRRRKSPSPTLLNSSEEVVDVPALIVALAGQSRAGFERMFSLDHFRLREGGDAILKAQDNVGQAIFAAGMGITPIKAICDALDEEVKSIWTKRSDGKKPYHIANNRYDTAKATLKSAITRPARWIEARRAVERLSAELLENQEQLAQRKVDAAEIERLRRTLVPVRKLDVANESLTELGPLPDMPADAGARFDTAWKEAELAQVQADQALKQIARLTEDLGKLNPNHDVLKVKPQIDTLRGQKVSIEDAVRDLPATTAERSIAAERLHQLQAEFSWPQESAAETQRRLPTASSIATLRELIERHLGVEQAKTNADEALEIQNETLEALKLKLAGLPPETQYPVLQATLASVKGSKPQSAMESAKSRNAAAATLVANRLGALAGWAGDLATLRALALPTVEDAATCSTRISSAREQVKTETGAYSSVLKRLETDRLNRDQLIRGHPAPTADAERNARTARDDSWVPIKEFVTAGTPLPDPAAAAGHFEQQISNTDQIADERFAAAEYAGGLIAIEQQLEQTQLQLEQAQRDVATATIEVDAALIAWSKLTACIGFEIEPNAFPAWCQSREAVLDAAIAAETEVEDLAAATRTFEACRRQMLDALGSINITVGQDAGFDDLLARMERATATAQGPHNERISVTAKIEAAQSAQTKSDRQYRQASAVLNEWGNKWTAALTESGLTHTDSLAAVRSQITHIEEVRSLVTTILSLDVRVNAMESALARFEASTTELAQACGFENSKNPLETMEYLVRQANEAFEAETKSLQLHEQAVSVENIKLTALDSITKAEAKLEPLQALASGFEGLELRAVITKTEAAKGLKAEIKALEKEILEAGDGRSLLELIAAASLADQAKLILQAEKINNEIESVNGRLQVLSADHRAAELAFNEMDDAPDAAIAAFDLEEARSEMEFQAEAYIRKRAEAKLLRWTIERYRNQKQAPLLARASQLFAILTLNRYAKLMVDYEAAAPLLCGVLADGARIVPAGVMSEGTRDQLYLALRVAAVEDAVAQGNRMPFLADDLFVNYDDARSASGFKVLAELARHTQVLFFTHHEHLLPIAERALSPAAAAVHHLNTI
jgi:uncharacterized protein YhaN